MERFLLWTVCLSCPFCSHQHKTHDGERETWGNLESTLNQIEPPRFPFQGSMLSPRALPIICFSGSPTKLSRRLLAKHRSSPFGRKSSPIGSKFDSIDRKFSPLGRKSSLLGRKSSPIGRKSSMAEGKESSKQVRGLWLPTSSCFLTLVKFVTSQGFLRLSFLLVNLGIGHHPSFPPNFRFGQAQQVFLHSRQG